MSRYAGLFESLPLVIILLFAWFAALIKWADVMVDGGSAFAKHFNISDLVIGLTIIAFGTSAPELIVNIISSSAGNNELVIGNILWSNMANILLILGAGALIKTLFVDKSTIRKEIPFMLLAMLILSILVNDTLIDGLSSSVLSAIDGIVLLWFFGIFLYYTYEVVVTTKEQIKQDEIHRYSISKSLLFILLWAWGLMIGGNLVVDSAIAIAERMAISQKVIWLTILAIGTSLPELVTTIVAVRKNKASLAIGNVVWSNIFNTLLVLPISAIISPIVFNPANNLDVIINLWVALLLFLTVFVGKKHHIQQRQWIWFLVVYVGYITTMIVIS